MTTTGQVAVLIAGVVCMACAYNDVPLTDRATWAGFAVLLSICAGLGERR